MEQLVESKKKTWISIAMAVLLATGTAGFALFGMGSGKEAGESTPKTSTKNQLARSTGSTAQGDVLIELTPQGFSEGELTVLLSANTHSVDLGKYDLKEATTLVIDGKGFKPEEYPAMRGHHVSGKLVFKTGVEADSFVIVIKGIPSVNERVFEWR